MNKIILFTLKSRFHSLKLPSKIVLRFSKTETRLHKNRLNLQVSKHSSNCTASFHAFYLYFYMYFFYYRFNFPLQSFYFFLIFKLFYIIFFFLFLHFHNYFHILFLFILFFHCLLFSQFLSFSNFINLPFISFIFSFFFSYFFFISVILFPHSHTSILSPLFSSNSLLISPTLSLYSVHLSSSSTSFIPFLRIAYIIILSIPIFLLSPPPPPVMAKFLCSSEKFYPYHAFHLLYFYLSPLWSLYCSLADYLT